MRQTQLPKDDEILIRQSANEIWHRIKGLVELDELFSAGSMGYLVALPKVRPDADSNTRAAYLTLRIKCAIIDELRMRDPLGRYTRRLRRRIHEAEWKLTHRLGREPTSEEVGADLQVSEERISSAMAYSSSVSIDGPANGYLMAKLKVEPNVLAKMSDKDIVSKLLDQDRAILNDKERLVIQAMYFEGRLEIDIGRSHGITESRVSQIHRSALDSLRLAYRRLTGMALPIPKVRTTGSRGRPLKKREIQAVHNREKSAVQEIAVSASQKQLSHLAERDVLALVNDLECKVAELERQSKKLRALVARADATRNSRPT